MIDVSNQAKQQYEANRTKPFTAISYQDICHAENDYLKSVAAADRGWYWLYQRKKSVATEPDANSDDLYIAEIIHKKTMRNIKKIAAQFVAIWFGILQGGGMMGFMLLLGSAGFFGNENTYEISGIDIDVWFIAFFAFAIGVKVNYWLPREELINAFVFEKDKSAQKDQKSSNGKDKKIAYLACLLSSCVIAATTATGLKYTFNSITNTSEDDLKSISLAIIAAIMLWIAFYRLMINPMKNALSNAGDHKSFFPRFDAYTHSVGAKLLWYTAALATTIAMTGAAFVSMPILAKCLIFLISEMGGEGNAVQHVGNSVSLCILALAAMCQVPLVLDRTSQYIERNFKKTISESSKTNSSEGSTLPKQNKLYYALVVPNALFGAPATYVGMVGALGALASLEEIGQSSIFPYGDVVPAMIIYTVGMIVFLAATCTSILMNSKPPPPVPNFDNVNENVSKINSNRM